MMPMPWPRPSPDRVPRPRTARSSPAIKRMRRSRMLGWDRNPLRRRIDRVEAAMVAGLIAVFLISAPVLAAGGRSLDRLRGHAGAARRSGLAPGAGHRAGQRAGANPLWAGGQGLDAGPLDGAGWAGAPRLDPGQPGRRGRRQHPGVGHPVGGADRTADPPAQVQARIAMAEWLTALVSGLLLCLADSAGRVLLARRRLADWNRAWREVEPRWTRQR